MPDDACHAGIFGFLSSFFYMKRPDIIAPTREIDTGAVEEEYDIDG